MTWTTKQNFYVLLLGLGALTLFLVWRYLGILFLALVLVVVFEPMYEWLLSKWHRAGLAATMSTLIVVVAMVVPLVVLISLAVEQAADVVMNWSHQLKAQPLSQNQIMSTIDTYIPGFSNQIQKGILNQQDQLNNWLQTLTQSLGQIITKGLVPVVKVTTNVVLDTIIFIMMLAYLFPVKKKILAKLRQLGLLEPEHFDRFVRRFEAVVRGTITSTLLIGLAQGVLGAIILWILGVQPAALWGLLMAVAAFIPFGAGLIWWPVVIVLVISGRYIAGLVLILYGVLVIHTVDNIIRPKVLHSGESALPELVTFVTVIGGISVFGFLGFIMGPLIAALFLTAIDFYLEERKVTRQGLPVEK